MTVLKSKLAIKLTLIGVLIFNSMNCFATDSTNVTNEKYRKLLPVSFKLAKKYEVINVEKADLNGDGLKDKIITWQKKGIIEGDTIHVTIYFRKDTSDIYFTDLINLYTLDFKYWSNESTGSSYLDSLKSMYADSNYGMIEFKKSQIIVGLSQNSKDGCDYYFVFDPKKKNWFLKFTQYWEGWNYLERKKGVIQNSSRNFPIQEFNILKELGY